MVGVLSPFIGGTYYGGIINGVARATGARGGRVVAVQTLDAGAYMTVNLGATDFTRPVAWDQVDGFVALPDAVDRSYLEWVSMTGKPVVLVGHEVAGLSLPTVLADNTTGIRDAVTHLFGHGYERIAFVGYVQATDVRERYDAYRHTLLEHGVAPEPELFFEAADNHDSGVMPIAGRLVDAVRPGTAVVAATDRNAVGVIRVLGEAGLRVPQDCPVIGFDDTDFAPFMTPSLASVRQLLDVMGGTAVDLLGLLSDARPVGPDPVRIPTLLVPRASCGCVTIGPLLVPDAGRTPRDRLAARLEALLPPATVRRERELAVWHAAVEYIVTFLETGAAAGDALADLYAVRPQQDSATIVGGAVREYADLVSGDSGRVVDLVLALAQIHGRITFAGNWHLRGTVSTQYEASIDLLHDREHDPRTLDWLVRTTATAGCLGLWSDSGGLEVFPGWRRGAAALVPPGPCAVAAFPPVELIDTVEGDEVLFVVPVKVHDSDWGMLAIAGEVETNIQDGREVMNQCAALLAVALDLREQQRLLREAAYRDSLTGLPNRAAFLEALDDVKEPVAVLFLDLDGFKHINDSLGHAAGDQILVHVADRMREHLRPTDIAARLGGDEFVVLLRSTAEDDLPLMVALLREAISRPVEISGEQVRVGVSIGTTTEPGTADEILLCADTAMYRVKTAGRAASRNRG